MPFDVLLAKQESLDTAALAAVFSKIENIPAADASRKARCCWGFAAQGIEEAPARELARRLQEAGVPAWALAHDSVAELPEARVLLKMPEELALRSLRLIAASAVYRETAKVQGPVPQPPDMTKKMLEVGILLTTGLPIKLGGQPKKEPAPQTRTETELLLFLDLYVSEPAQRLRIDAQNFDYSFLKERMLYNVLGNFKLLVGDMAASAPQALRNRGTRILLAGRPLREMGYASLADVEREARWLLTIA